MTTWLRYLAIGKRIYALLRTRFPDLGQVPIEDIISVVEELITTTATVTQTDVISESTPARLMGHSERHLRLVITGKPGAP